ncbi:MAG: cytochrome c oxidase subunit II [Emcibacteraceae bacterium]|nr:cytochrome c oxidase subunit II [Emcibacteraceae bacterium]
MLFKKTFLMLATMVATFISTIVTAIALEDGARTAFEDGIHSAKPGQLGFMEAATPIMAETIAFHDLLLWITGIITLLVTGILVYIFIKFNAKANPVASKTTHNTLLEILWTAVPVLILVLIAVPSFRLMYNQDVIPEADITIKAIGNQWYWTYEYLDYEEIVFDANMLEEGDADYDKHPRLLGSDASVVVPVNKIVRVQVTATDVIHAWAMPAFGVKIDAVPGKLNETWFKATKEGLYYGQCSELCGIRHGFMPIMVEVVSQERYEAWLEEAKVKYASIDAPRLQQYASAQSLTE